MIALGECHNYNVAPGFRLTYIRTWPIYVFFRTNFNHLIPLSHFSCIKSSTPSQKALLVTQPTQISESILSLLQPQPRHPAMKFGCIHRDCGRAYRTWARTDAGRVLVDSAEEKGAGKQGGGVSSRFAAIAIATASFGVRLASHSVRPSRICAGQPPHALPVRQPQSRPDTAALICPWSVAPAGACVALTSRGDSWVRMRQQGMVRGGVAGGGLVVGWWIVAERGWAGGANWFLRDWRRNCGNYGAAGGVLGAVETARCKGVKSPTPFWKNGASGGCSMV